MAGRSRQEGELSGNDPDGATTFAAVRVPPADVGGAADRDCALPVHRPSLTAGRGKAVAFDAGAPGWNHEVHKANRSPRVEAPWHQRGGRGPMLDSPNWHLYNPSIPHPSTVIGGTATQCKG